MLAISGHVAELFPRLMISFRLLSARSTDSGIREDDVSSISMGRGGRCCVPGIDKLGLTSSGLLVIREISLDGKYSGRVAKHVDKLERD